MSQRSFVSPGNCHTPFKIEIGQTCERDLLWKNSWRPTMSAKMFFIILLVALGVNQAMATSTDVADQVRNFFGGSSNNTGLKFLALRSLKYWLCCKLFPKSVRRMIHPYSVERMLSSCYLCFVKKFGGKIPLRCLSQLFVALMRTEITF